MTRAEVQQITLRRGAKNPLPVMESFYTIQGEGSWTGTAAYFIRLAGCDVGCFWCDVKESWVPTEDQYKTCEEVAADALAAGAEKVVVTGGEPTIYDLSELTETLHAAGLQVHIETAGPYELIGDLDWVCLSPKKFLKPTDSIYEKVDELKVVIYNDDDFKWAEQHAARCPESTQLYLQAEWSRRDQNYAKIVQYVKENPKWKISVQTHKYLDIP